MSIQSLGSSGYLSANSQFSISSSDSDSDSDLESSSIDESTYSSSESDSDSSSYVSWDEIKKRKNKFILDATKKLTPVAQDIVASGIASAGVVSTHKTKDWAHKKLPTVTHGIVDSSVDKTGKTAQKGLTKVAKCGIASTSAKSGQVTIKSTDKSMDKSANKKNSGKGGS